MSQMCYCLQPTPSNRCEVNVHRWIKPVPNKLVIDESEQLAEVGYTCCMLLMLATVMTVVLVRAMRLGNNGASEVDEVLEQMRHREFNERCERDKQRLRKAKRKVVKWMKKRKMKQNKKAERPFRNLPILLPPFVSSLAAVKKNDVLRATIDCLPEIVVTDPIEQPQQMWWARRPTLAGPRKSVHKEKFQWDSIDSTTSGTNANSPGVTSVASMQFDFNFSETSDGDYSSDDISSTSNDFLVVPRWRYGSTASEFTSLRKETTVSQSVGIVRRSSFSCPRFPTTSDDDAVSCDDTIKYRSPVRSNVLLCTDFQTHSAQFL